MKRSLKLPIKFRNYKDHTSVKIDVTDDLITDWCLHLSLLERKLIDSLAIQDRGKQFNLKISMNDYLQPSEVGRGLVNWNSEGAHTVITKTELEVWLHFFLKYYRDGIGEVDHIDLDIPPSKSIKGIFITLAVSKALPPLSAKEAKRLLDLD